MKKLFSAVLILTACGGQDAITLVPPYADVPPGGGEAEWVYVPQHIPPGDFIEGYGTPPSEDADAGTAVVEPDPSSPQCLHATPKGKAKGWHRVCGQ